MLWQWSITYNVWVNSIYNNKRKKMKTNLETVWWSHAPNLFLLNVKRSLPWYWPITLSFHPLPPNPSLSFTFFFVYKMLQSFNCFLLSFRVNENALKKMSPKIKILLVFCFTSNGSQIPPSSIFAPLSKRDLVVYNLLTEKPI